MGVGVLLRVIGRNDTERRIMINAIAPHWDGNQGMAYHRRWCTVRSMADGHAAAFSGFYIAMILVLAALFFRPVGFDYRSKLESQNGAVCGTGGIFIGSFVPSLVIGVAFGNLF